MLSDEELGQFVRPKTLSAASDRAIGASMGGNFFQAADPPLATTRIAAVVHDRAGVDRALETVG